MNAWIYVLHLENGNHFMGSTTKLRKRLIAHANREGAKLCQDLLEFDWRLGGLFQTTATMMRNIEKCFPKDAIRFCSLCGRPDRIPNTLPIDLTITPFPTTSLELRTKDRHIHTVAFTDLADDSHVDFIKQQMRAEKKALGFIPMSEEGGLRVLYNSGRIAIAQADAKDVGYMVYTTNPLGVLTIHQAVTADEHRLSGHARMMLHNIHEKNPGYIIQARVRADLTANLFWQAMGFIKIGEETHKTSKSKINIYRIEPEYPFPIKEDLQKLKTNAPPSQHDR